MSREERVLEALKESEDGLTIQEVIRKTGISKTAAIKYLATFKMAGRPTSWSPGLRGSGGL